MSKNSDILDKARARFGIDTRRFKVTPYFPARLTLRRFNITLVVSDGSIPFLPFGKSILLFMSPFTHVDGQNFLTQTKLRFINHILCFSNYTKKYIDQEFGTKSQVIYPAVSPPSSTLPKQNIILSVGRFTPMLHQKNQLFLVKTFIKFEKKLPDWKLVLVGGTEKGSDTLLKQIKTKAQGHSIDIKTDVTGKTLHHLYAQAKLYWHAAGFGQNLAASPEKAEHFGISIVEAMGNGTVPLVFAAGGPTEIVTPQSGVLWRSQAELIRHTLTLVASDSRRLRLAAAAKKRASFFNSDRFCQSVYALVNKTGK
ncbi:MAG: glycosyltransferase [Candidatus Chisholmbacteria bacterium]|nr:glycosyltransferase [Candidatus Chisholmbacteria bacterium]